MKLVKIGFPELSTGQNKSAGSGDLGNSGIGQTFPNTNENKTIFVLRGCAGVEHSARVDNKRLGPIFVSRFEASSGGQYQRCNLFVAVRYMFDEGPNLTMLILSLLDRCFNNQAGPDQYIIDNWIELAPIGHATLLFGVWRTTTHTRWYQECEND